MSTVERRLAELQHPLPHPAAPVASYVPAVRVGELVISSGQLPIVGKEVMRQPSVQVRLNAGFSQTIGRYGWAPYGSLHYIGSRYADNVNTTRYDSYVTLDAGIELVTPARITLRIAAENLTDRHDPTEGDPRSAIIANIRPILGRSAAFSVTYQF